jgi:hypothetical protein
MRSLNARIARLERRTPPARPTLYRMLLPGMPESSRMTEEYARAHGRLFIPDEDRRHEGPSHGGCDLGLMSHDQS